MPAHSRSKNGVAEPVIGPATSGRTRWLAYGGHPRLFGFGATKRGWPGQARP